MKKGVIIFVYLVLLSCSTGEKEADNLHQSDEVLTGSINQQSNQFIAEKEIKLVLLESNPNTFTGSMEFTNTILESPEKTGTEIEKIKFVLSTLLSLGIPSVGENQYNSLFLSKAYVRDVFVENGVVVVDFEGIFQGTQNLKKYIKVQIEKNIAQYSEDYEVRLNRSKKQWDCLFETTPECSNIQQGQPTTVSQTGTSDNQSSTGTTDVLQ